MAIRWPRRLLGATLAALLAGCGGGGKSEHARPEGPLEVVLWEMMDPQERLLLEEHRAAFEASHPDIRMTTVHFGEEDLEDRFLTAAADGGGPDVIYGPSAQVGPLSGAGALRPLDDVFGETFFQRFHPLTREKLRGHQWAVPEQFGIHLVLVTNRTLVPGPPTDTNELIRIAQENTRDDDGDGTIDRYGLVFETNEPLWLVPWLGAFGGWVLDGNAEPTLDSEAMVSALTFVRDLRTEHGILPEDCDYGLADTLFREGRAAMIVTGPRSWAAYRDAGMNIELAPIPRMASTGFWPSPMVSYRGYSISTSSPDYKLEAVEAFIEYLTGSEVQEAYAARLGSLPSLLALHGKRIESDPLLSRSMEQVRRGKPMPIASEMRAVWDAMRPALQNVMNGKSTPRDAAREMQKLAVRKIAEMRG